MRRLAAAGVAVVLIVVALVIRNRHDEQAKQGPYRLTCATEFEQICGRLAGKDIAVAVEPASTTADRVGALVPGDDPGFDGWLSAGRWNDMVVALRQAAGATGYRGRPTVLGHSRVAIVGWRDRLGVLRQACGGALNWKCIGDAAARGTWKANGGPESWGPLKLALADPSTESSGLAGLVAATGGFDAALLTGQVDPRANDAFVRWLGGLARARTQPVPDIASVLSSGPAVADVVVGLEAEMQPVVAESARRADVEVAYLSPVLDVDAVMVAASSRAVPDRIRVAVRDRGWAPAPAPSTGPFPPAAVVAALRGLWKDTIR